MRVGWAIENVSSLEWALSRLAALETEEGSIEAAAAEMHRRVDERKARLLDAIARGVSFFRGKIAEYAEPHRGELLGGGKKKSRTFLSGTVGWKKKGGLIRVQDKKALADWLVAQPDLSLFRTEVAPEMRRLQEYCAANKCVPPGCSYEDERDELFVDAVDPAAPLARKG